VLLVVGERSEVGQPLPLVGHSRVDGNRWAMGEAPVLPVYGLREWGREGGLRGGHLRRLWSGHLRSDELDEV
jgi:hypothetical protein